MFTNTNDIVGQTYDLVIVHGLQKEMLGRKNRNAHRTSRYTVTLSRTAREQNPGCSVEARMATLLPASQLCTHNGKCLNSFNGTFFNESTAFPVVLWRRCVKERCWPGWPESLFCVLWSYMRAGISMKGLFTRNINLVSYKGSEQFYFSRKWHWKNEQLHVDCSYWALFQ